MYGYNPYDPNQGYPPPGTVLPAGVRTTFVFVALSLTHRISKLLMLYTHNHMLIYNINKLQHNILTISKYLDKCSFTIVLIDMIPWGSITTINTTRMHNLNLNLPKTIIIHNLHIHCHNIKYVPSSSSSILIITLMLFFNLNLIY
jgi:hypothetical protein